MDMHACAKRCAVCRAPDHLQGKVARMARAHTHTHTHTHLPRARLSSSYDAGQGGACRPGRPGPAAAGGARKDCVAGGYRVLSSSIWVGRGAGRARESRAGAMRGDCQVERLLVLLCCFIHEQRGARSILESWISWVKQGSFSYG
eukprot:1159738-Pelagomonas_calceolata.AAC.7